MSRGLHSLFSAPNLLSLSRLALAPVFLVVRQPEVRLGLVVVAALTDAVDGWIARRTRSTSRLGAILDPLADRAFVLTALLALLVEGALSATQVAVLLGRDIATTIGFAVARTVRSLRGVELRARWPGKLVTGLQVLALLTVLAWPAAVPLIVILVGIASAFAIADYTAMLWRERERS